jgi:hypothetical protein
MPNNPRPTVVGYKDLFFQLDSAELPSFEQLHTLNFPSVAPNEELPPELQKTITKELAAIHHLCAHLGFRPLVSELALISDERMLAPKVQPYFSSYISFFIQPAVGVAEEYVEALTYMGTPEAGFEQIVPHSELFNNETALVHLECAGRTGASLSGEGARRISEMPAHLAAKRQPFRLIETPDRRLHEQATVFVNRFLSNIRRREELAEAADILAGSTFLLLPFVRPHFKSSVRIKTANLNRGSAGGALFLFLVRSNPDTSIEDLARALSWLIAEASLRESYASFDLEHNKKELLGSMVHGTVHTIRAIGTSELSRAISFKDPPDTREDLRVRIFERDSDKEDDRRAELLVRALKAAMLGEDTAAALLAFCEIQLNDGVLRTKFQNDKEARVRTLLEEGLLLANAWPATRPEYAEVQLTAEEEAPPVGASGGHWIIPEYYLNAKLIRGLLGEFIRNASFYGKRTPEGKVDMQCRIYSSPEGALAVTLTNEVSTHSEDELVPVTGFLERTRTVLGDLKGIALDYEKKVSSFSITLRLETMSVEVPGSTSYAQVKPLWSGG